MKTEPNKKFKILRLTILSICYLGIMIFIIGFNNSDDEKPNCGCESETIDTVPSDYFPEVPIEEQKSGLIFYKRAENVDNIFDDEHNGKYNNYFWILRGAEGCYNCKHHFIVCNKDFLGSEFDFLKNVNDSIPVSFSGDLKYLCVEPFATPADYSYAEIKLNSIEQQ
ncbi:hypothetical protein [Formosa sp. A9]|uniref:hypothetical protein n=1 Tax=Formosa sp. A9 TaxID=3442641 RepID=UPI003EB78B1F